MHPGENTHPDRCEDCNCELKLTVVRTPAGYFIGTVCDCGPCYSRESDYYRTQEKAQKALETGSYERS